MERLWSQYQRYGYDTQLLHHDADRHERGVDHNIIGQMWRLLALHGETPSLLVLASGDGNRNEFGTSFLEVLSAILTTLKYPNWQVELATFDWAYPTDAPLRSPTSRKMRDLVEQSPRARLINLLDHYPSIVYHKN
jgi:hypothetical protein